MSNNSLFRAAGWSAYLSAAATVLGAVTLIIFFSVGDPFGVINDVISIVGSPVIIPVLLALCQLHRSTAPAASFGALVIGIISMLVAAVLQTLLVVKCLTYEETAAIVPSAYGAVGLSLIIQNCLAYVDASSSRRLGVWGIVGGAGCVTECLGFVLAGPKHPVTYLGDMVSIIAYPTWAIWTGNVVTTYN